MLQQVSRAQFPSCFSQRNVARGVDFMEFLIDFGALGDASKVHQSAVTCHHL